ncbi:MAG TPA: mechanosensitive ion channel domain-containing protein, partial [Polyangiales bacterium]
IQVDNVSGTVEVIGLRSTRIRTVDRTLITIPNGKLADMRIETVSARDRIRFYALIGVVHSASARVGEIISGIEALLRDNEVITKSSISVRLIAITDSALNLELSAICELTDYDRFMSVRQALLLGVIEVVEQFGAALAHPTRNIELDPDFTRQILEKRG